MTAYKQLDLIVSIASNSPGMPTGYGVQTQMLLNNMKRHGIDVASLSNYGLEGRPTTIQTPYGEAPHYPRGYTLYSGDVLSPFHKHHVGDRTLPNFVLTLYDTWVFNEVPNLDDIDFVSWVPIDHVTIPPKVEVWCRRNNVHPIAMSPFGKRMLDASGIESTYIPHAYDSSVYKPTDNINGQPIREYYGLKDDDFLVGMVSANKANGSIHRKAFAENLLAFALFKKEHPNAYLYIHSEPSKVFGGFHLPNLITAVGLSKNDVLFPSPEKLRFGYTDEEMAALYTGMDVLLHPSYGEGFGVPAIEAQGCGTRVIASNWAASQDLVAEDGWLVDGQPFWDEAQSSFYQIPLVPSIVAALKMAYEAERGTSQAALDFAKQFDVEAVWQNYWMPFLEARAK